MIENNQVALMNKNDSADFDDLDMGDYYNTDEECGEETRLKVVVNDQSVIKICTIQITGMTCANC